MDVKAIAILIFISCLPPAKSMEFDENDYKSGLIFEKISDARITYDSFSLIYHADITQYHSIKHEIRGCYDGLKRICTFERFFCDITYMTIDRRLAKLAKNEADINLYQLKPQKRERREVVTAIAAVALATSFFIGLIDAIRAKQISNQIEGLKADHEKISRIEHDGLLFLKENIVTEKRVFRHLQGATNVLIGEFKNMSLEQIKGYTRETRYIFISRIEQIMNHWFLEHEYASEMILNHLHSAMYGRYSHLIPIQQFKTDLIDIESQLSEGQRLPINMHSENPMNIFKFSTIKAAIYDTKLLIEISIPKMDHELYTLYKIIPIPIHTDTFMSVIIPSMEYVLIDQTTANFIPISNDNWKNAPINTNNEKIISPTSNIHHDFRDNCEMTLKLNPHATNVGNLCNFRTIPTTNYFISLNSFNRYFISLTKPTTLIEFCPGKQVFSKHVSSSGFLTLTENCRIQTDKITLRPRIKTIVNKQSEMQMVSDLSNITYEALAERMRNFSEPLDLHSSESSLLIDDHIQDFDELADGVDNLIEQASDRNTFEEMHGSKMKHNFFIVGGILSIFFISIAILVYCLYSKFHNVDTWVNLAERISPVPQANPVIINNLVGEKMV